MSHFNEMRGVYNIRSFYVDFASEIFEKLSLDYGLQIDEKNPESIEMYSTFIHETLHWWQAIGSISGLIDSLSGFIVTLLLRDEIKYIIDQIGVKKSFITYLSENYEEDSDLINKINLVVNTYKDACFFQTFIRSGDAIRRLHDDPFFSGRGHSLCVVYHEVSRILETYNNEQNLPTPLHISTHMDRMIENENDEYTNKGGSIYCNKIGLNDILEGQAIFSQMQFVSKALKRGLDLSYFKSVGLYHGIYKKAFECFLTVSEINFSGDTLSKEVGIFLLICDISINPSVGFLDPILCDSNFLYDVDPGVRFIRLCLALKERHDLVDILNNYDKDEYIQLTRELCKEADLPNSYERLHKIKDWIDTSEELKSIMEKGKNFDFSDANMAVRLILYKFLSFSLGKMEFPDFVCWTGYKLFNNEVGDAEKEFWGKNQTLFTKRNDKPGVYPRIIPGIEEDVYNNTFNDFYSFLLVNNITKQIIERNGNFDLYFGDIINCNADESYEWANAVFKNMYGINVLDE